MITQIIDNFKYTFLVVRTNIYS